jgi:peptide/nickel transport system substrate-binding protein
MDRFPELLQALRLGRMSRRAFLQNALAAGVGATVATSVADQALAQTVKRGGHFRLGSSGGSTTDSYDPATFNNGRMRNFISASCNYLLEINSKGEAAPELALSFEPNANATSFTVKLRRGITFHDGKTFKAEDVIASVNHHRTETSSSAVKAILKPIVDIRSEDDYTVVFKLEEGNADFPYIFTDYHLPIYPSRDGKLDTSKIVGTGGYIVERDEPGVRAQLKRNPNYWKEGHANFDSAEIITISDVVARTNALTTVAIDGMDRPGLSTIQLLAKRPGVRIMQATGSQYYSVLMDTRVAPFDNLDFRLAMKHAIDREMIIKTILRGYAKTGNDNPITPAYRYHNDTLEQRKYDIEKAKHHLKKSGVGNVSLDLSVSNAPFAGAVDAAVLFKEHAAKAGINLNIIREPEDGYWTNVWRKKPFCVGYIGGRGTVDWMFSTSFAEASPWNDTHWKNDRFNMLLKSARAELNEAKRKEIYFEMQQIVRDDGATIIFALPDIVVAVRDRVKNRPVSVNWEMDGDRCIDRWWFA